MNQTLRRDHFLRVDVQSDDGDDVLRESDGGYGLLHDELLDGKNDSGRLRRNSPCPFCTLESRLLCTLRSNETGYERVPRLLGRGFAWCIRCTECLSGVYADGILVRLRRRLIRRILDNHELDRSGIRVRSERSFRRVLCLRR